MWCKCDATILIKFTSTGMGGVMVFNTTFNNISVIFSQSVLLVEEIAAPGENPRPATSHWQTLSYIIYRDPYKGLLKLVHLLLGPL